MTALSAVDRLDIIELQSIYAWGIDGKDGSQFARAFADDIEVDYTTLGRIRGLDRLTELLDAFHAPFDQTQHLISNHQLTVDADEVVHRSYFLVNIFCAAATGGAHFSGGGHYVDRVVRSDSGWRIRSREAINVWRGGNPGVLEVGGQAVARMRRSRDG